MKWNEMSVFHKIVYLTGCLCALVYAVIVICYLVGILPSVYELPWAQVLFSVSWLSQGVINWRRHQALAILDYITAFLAFVTALLGWFAK